MKRNRITGFTTIELTIVIAIGSVATLLGFMVHAQGRPSGLDKLSGATAYSAAINEHDRDEVSRPLTDEDIKILADLPYIPSDRPRAEHGADMAELASKSQTSLYADWKRAQMAASAVCGHQITWSPIRMNNPLYACLKLQEKQ